MPKVGVNPVKCGSDGNAKVEQKSPGCQLVCTHRKISIVSLVLSYFLYSLCQIHHVLAIIVRQAKSALPGVSVVLPVKGYRKHSLQNWHSQLQSNYSGPKEYLFVVDSQV